MRDDLPDGTVTFLFTDVEGSTRLLEELGADSYAEALDGHRDVIRAALVDHGGVEVDTQGDAFLCVFESARAAVACAADTQLRLADGPLRVRMGVHTGDALLAGDHYVGIDVHRGARIGACGHGGQVVLSPATVGLLEPGSFPLRDLGEHRLKDLSAPVRLYQLGDDEFGPLKTLFRTNLPVPATEFVGREVELRQVVARLSESSVRLLTVTGPGGTGKTRFALQLAGELADGFPDGVFWVPLAALREPGLVTSAVAQALDVEETPGESLSAAVSRSLAAKRLLLLLDNCEHVLDAAAAIVSPLLRGCPDIVLLATSREPLAITGEHVHDVRPLLPSDAVTLFEARARAAGAAVESWDSSGALGTLCARLDNLPLAVELAAARAAALPPAAMLDRLSDRLDVLKGPRDADERHRTLRATIAWSHDLLDAGEKRLFRRLAVFSGGAALDVIEDVCEADLEELMSLVARSLVRQAEEGGEPRYWMLETIREFAANMLEESGEAAEYRDRHLHCYAGLARAARDRLAGSGSSDWLSRLEQDRENLRVAFRWAVERAEDGNLDASSAYGGEAVALGNVFAPLHQLHGRYAEAEDVLRGALRLGPNARDAAGLQSRLGRVLRHRGRPGEGLEAHLAAERLLDSVAERADRWWEAWIDVKLEQAHHHYFQADLDALAGVIEKVRPHVERAGSPLQKLDFLHVLVQDACRRERYTLSEETEALVREIYRRSLELDDVDADFTLGFGLLWRGKLREAEGAFQRGLGSARRRGDALIEARCLVYQAVARRRRTDVEGVRSLLAELDTLDELHGYAGLIAANHAWVAYRDGDHEAAARFAHEAFRDWEPARRSGPTVFQWTARFPMVGVELARNRPEAALDHARVMLESSQQPLPRELEALVAHGVWDGDGSLLRPALDLARMSGHA